MGRESCLPPLSMKLRVLPSREKGSKGRRPLPNRLNDKSLAYPIITIVCVLCSLNRYVRQKQPPVRQPDSFRQTEHHRGPRFIGSMPKLVARWFRLMRMCFGHRKKLVDEEQAVSYTDCDWLTTRDETSAIPATSEAPRQVDPQHFLSLGGHRSPDYDWSGRFTKPTFTSEELGERLEMVQYERHLGLNFTAERFEGEPPHSRCDAVSAGYDYTRDLADLVWQDSDQSTLFELLPPEYSEEQPPGQDSQVVVTVTELTDDSFNDKTERGNKLFPLERRAVASNTAGSSLLSGQDPCLTELAEYKPLGLEEPDSLTGTMRGGAGSREPDDSIEDVVIEFSLNATAAPFQPPIPLQATLLIHPSEDPILIPVLVSGSRRPQRLVVTPGRMLWLYIGAKGEVRGPFSRLAMHHWYCAGRIRRLNNWIKRLEDDHFETREHLVHHIDEPFLVSHDAGVHDTTARPVGSTSVDATSEITGPSIVDISRCELDGTIRLFKIDQSMVRRGFDPRARSCRHYVDDGSTHYPCHSGKGPGACGTEPLRNSDITPLELDLPVLGQRSYMLTTWDSKGKARDPLIWAIRQFTPLKGVDQPGDHEKNRYMRPISSGAMPMEMSRAVPAFAFLNAIVNNPTCRREIRARPLWYSTRRAAQKRLRYRLVKNLGPRALEMRRISQLSQWGTGLRHPKNRIPIFHLNDTHGRMGPEWRVSSSPNKPVDMPSLRGGCSSDAEEQYHPDDSDSDSDSDFRIVLGSSSKSAAKRSVNEITLAVKSLEEKPSKDGALIFVRPTVDDVPIDIEDSFIAKLFAEEKFEAATLLSYVAAEMPLSKSDLEGGYDTENSEDAANRLVDEIMLATELPLSGSDTVHKHNTELYDDANQVRDRRLNPAADEFVPTTKARAPPPNYAEAITVSLAPGLQYSDLARGGRYRRQDTELPPYDECSQFTVPPYTRYHVEPVTFEQARGVRMSMVNVLRRYRGQRLPSSTQASRLADQAVAPPAVKSHLGPLTHYQSAAELVNAYHASVPPVGGDVELLWQLSGHPPTSAPREARVYGDTCWECETCRENQREDEVWYYWAWNNKSPATSWKGDVVAAEDATWRDRSKQRRCERSRAGVRGSMIPRRVLSVTPFRGVEVEHNVAENIAEDYLSQTSVEVAREYPTQDIIMQEVNGEIRYFDAREVEDAWSGRAAAPWTCTSREMNGQNLAGGPEKLD